MGWIRQCSGQDVGWLIIAVARLWNGSVSVVAR